MKMAVYRKGFQSVSILGPWSLGCPGKLIQHARIIQLLYAICTITILLLFRGV